jgi:hypothetical protein
MLRHLVLLRYRPDVPAGTRAALMRDLAAVVAALPGLSGFTVHRNVSVEAPMIKGFLDGFHLDFADAAARDRYLADPDHAAVGARIVAHVEGGADGVIVFDHAL